MSEEIKNNNNNNNSLSNEEEEEEENESLNSSDLKKINNDSESDINNKENNNDDSISDTFSNEEQEQEEKVNETEFLENELKEVDFGSLIKAKENLQKAKKKEKENKKINKTKILENMKKINKNKNKNAPREFSALLKPKDNFKERILNKTNNLLGKKKHFNDPRFNDYSGDLNINEFKKNYSFVNNLAEKYVKNLDNLKNNKKIKITDDQFELIKKQKNFVKGWISQQKINKKKLDVKNEIKKENKLRIKEGKKPIYINDNKIKKFIKNNNNNNNNN